MASPVLFRNGFAGTTGAALATTSPIWALNGGVAWFVNSVGGVDAASPAGKDRAKPLATAAQAITNAAAGDTIVFLAGHVQALAAVVTVNKAGLKLISEGTGSNAARFACNSTGGCFAISAAGCLLSGLYFPASTVAATNARVDVAVASPTVLENLYFEMGAIDTTAAVRWGSVASSTGLRVTGCSFVATAATQAAVGISVVTNAASALYMDNVIFDGGTVGFSDYAFKGSVAITNIDARTVSQLNNAHVSLAAASTGTWGVGTITGASRFEQA